MRLMSRCAVFVMGSRSEAMGRVTLEAMAARRAIVASAVDGVPHYVKDGFNGLLFEPGDPKDLARKLRTLLKDRELAARLATNAYDHLHAELDEAAFVRRFDELLDAVLPDRREEPAASPGDAG
jgi:glycosyltransferase involved in cell wall biosynthesis